MAERDFETQDGGKFWFHGNLDQAKQEYERFRGCIGQLLDDETMVGDVEGRWVVFQNGWVYGMAAYNNKIDAVRFARLMFRDEPEATYIVVLVDVNKHGLNAMEVLASTVSDGPGIDLSTTPDERNRKPKNGD